MTQHHSTTTELRGAGRDEREALVQLLAQLAAVETAAAEGSATSGEVAVPFRANGQTVADVTTAAVSAVLEQQETYALLISRVDLDGWLATADGIQAWGVLTGVPDAAPPSGHEYTLAAQPEVTTDPGGVTITVTLSGKNEPAG
jgi:hypothetical protein